MRWSRADDDADSTIAVDVTSDGAGYRVVCGATDQVVTAEALASTTGIWVAS